MTDFPVFLTFSLMLFYYANECDADCIIDVVSNTPNFSPLVFSLNETFFDPIDPSTRNILIRENEEFWIACPGGTFIFNRNFSSDGEKAKCIVGNTIDIKDQELQFSDMRCLLNFQERPHLLAVFTTLSCENGGSIIKIGYDYASGFVSVYHACITPGNSVALYIKYVITQWADIVKNHHPTSTLVGLESEIPQYYEEHHIQTVLGEYGYNGTNTLLESRLAANDDFFYPFQRDATSCYTNIAPQWKTIKEGNWLVLERAIRKIVTQGFHENLIVYAGTLGVASVEHTGTGGVTQLYLNKPKVPVPRWFWKIIYSPQKQQGNIFFTYNNPYITNKKDVNDEFVPLCTNDVIRDTEWLSEIDNTNAESGFTYACLLGEVRDSTIHEIIGNLVSSTQNYGPLYVPAL